MKDDFDVPNFGTAPAHYDGSYFNRLSRSLETVMTSLKSVGRPKVLSLGIEPAKVATLNLLGAKVGTIAYASDGRKHGEGAGLGTGVLVFYDGSAWCACDTGLPVSV
jgi:hypothetical protein